MKKLLVGVLLVLPVFFFAQNVKAAEATIDNNNVIYTCGDINLFGDYTLSATSTFNTGSGTCFNITTDDVTIDGNGLTVTGNIVGSNGTNGVRPISATPGVSITLSKHDSSRYSHSW